ncbi:MAG: hypothetical protein LBE18_03790 [Planctomycetaceae bacterium]|jgi:hypothetical protein|nr:hypothetical protein [Planctomycetaceae bacterium]
MTLFDDERYAWRETYFVLFEPEMRPQFAMIRKIFNSHVGCFSVLDKKINKDNTMESLTIASYEDHAAIEIVYSEGENVLLENEALFKTISKDCPQKERELLHKAKKMAARYSVLHFEQVAGTAIFKVTKKPELQFASPLDRIVEKATSSNLKKIKQNYSNENSNGNKVTNRPKFHFDPTSYKKCLLGKERLEINNNDDNDDNDDIENERIDPNTLIAILNVLCNMTNGIVIDPASGIVWDENLIKEDT